MTSIAAILLLLLFILSMKVMRRRPRKFLRASWAYNITVLYCIVGIVAFLLLQIGPIERVEKLITEHELLIKDEETENLLKLLYEGQTEQIAAQYVIDTQSVVATDDELYIRTNNNTVRGVISYRNDNQSDEIIATIYRVTSIFNGYDITAYMNPVNIDVVDNLLYVTSQQKQLNILNVYGEMVHLTNKEINGYYGLNGQHVVHISVPQQKKVIIEESDFEEVSL